MLANMYGNGEGMARDLVSAYAWFDIAATLRPGEEPGPEAAALMATAVEKREQTIKLLLPEQEVQAQQQATDWWSKHYQSPSAPQKKSPQRPAR
jgi:TPR repeat protein